MEEVIGKYTIEEPSNYPAFMAIDKSRKDRKQKRGFGSFFSSAFASDFSFLEELDNVSGRLLDNASFFSVENPSSISDEKLYDLLMEEYPRWVKEACQKGQDLF
jgi:hypothetical protein